MEETPLQKVLLQMDLSKGLDERSSKEVGGDQSKLITVLNNLVQDNTGAWVKRPGMVAVATALDSSFSFSDYDSVQMFHLNQTNDKLTPKGALSEFSVEGNIVTSNSSNSLLDNIGYRIIAYARSSTIDVVAYETGFDLTASFIAKKITFVLYDRVSGQAVERVLVTTQPTATDKAYNVRMCFIADRYLHIYYHDNNGGVVSWKVYDLANGINSTTSSSGSFAGGRGILADIAIGSDRSYMSAYTAGGDSQIGYVTLSGAASGSATVTNIEFQGATVNLVDDEPIFAGKNVTSGFAEWRQFSNTLAAVSTQTSSVAGTGTWSCCFGLGQGVILIRVPAPSGSFCTFDIYPQTFDTAADQTVKGWFPISTPFYCRNTDAIYVHLLKQDEVSDVGTQVIARVSGYSTALNYGQKYFKSGANIREYFFLSLAAIVENSVAFTATKDTAITLAPEAAISKPVRLSYPTPYFDVDTDELGCASVLQVTARTAAIAAYSLKPAELAKVRSERFGNISYLTGGYLAYYDERVIGEVGFADKPVFTAANGAAGNPNGSYNLVAVYKSVDSKGNISLSQTYGPVSVSPASAKIDIVALPPYVIRKELDSQIEDKRTIIEIYRTVTAGQEYYLTATTQEDLSLSGTDVQTLALQTDGTFTCSDNLSDANLSNNPIMHRQPGIDNTALDRFSAPPCTLVQSHKDRLFVNDQYGDRVFYSSFNVDGEQAWFSPQFSFYLHGGTGRITALSSMDSRLIVFRRDAIFVVDGDGPPENGGTGTEFSPPFRLAVPYGAISPEVLQTPIGLFYRSARGIELLTRSLQNSYIGERVQSSLDSFPDITSMVLDKNSRVRIFCNSTTSLGVTTTKELVYDIAGDCWSTSTYTYDGGSSEHIVSAASAVIDGQEEVVLSVPSGSLYKLSDSTWTDDGNYVPWTVETGIIRPSGAQGRFRFYDLHILGKKSTHHALKASISYDYAGYTQTKTWQPDVLSSTLEEVNLNPNKQTVVGFQVKIEDNQPSDTVTYPITTGRGLDLLGVAFWVAPKFGPQLLASTKKG